MRKAKDPCLKSKHDIRTKGIKVHRNQNTSIAVRELAGEDVGEWHTIVMDTGGKSVWLDANSCHINL